MNNMLNSKLLNLLAGVDKNRLEQVSNIINNMSKEDLNNIVNMLGINNNRNNDGNLENNGEQ